MFNKVAIVGLGLIGGSLAMCIRQAYPSIDLVGIDTNFEEIQLAQSLDIVTTASTDLAAVKGADLLIVATPVPYIPDVVCKCAPLMATNGIITDVGSTKGWVCRESLRVLQGSTQFFIGGHPMAGSEQGGLAAATPILFENASYVLTPGDTPAKVVEKLTEFLRCTGAYMVQMEAQEHDYNVARVSHLPHLIASTLAYSMSLDDSKSALKLAGGGFRDTTRVASGRPELWTGILMSNKDAVLTSLHSYREALNAFESALLEGCSDTLNTLLAMGKTVRDSVPKANKGDMPPTWDIVVVLADEPGAINRVAQRLGDLGISITDIEILRIREGFGGTLRIGFSSEVDALSAEAALRAGGYGVKMR